MSIEIEAITEKTRVFPFSILGACTTGMVEKILKYATDFKATFVTFDIRTTTKFCGGGITVGGFILELTINAETYDKDSALAIVNLLAQIIATRATDIDRVMFGCPDGGDYEMVPVFASSDLQATARTRPPSSRRRKGH